MIIADCLYSSGIRIFYPVTQRQILSCPEIDRLKENSRGLKIYLTIKSTTEVLK